MDMSWKLIRSKILAGEWYVEALPLAMLHLTLRYRTGPSQKEIGMGSPDIQMPMVVSFRIVDILAERGHLPHLILHEPVPSPRLLWNMPEGANWLIYREHMKKQTS